MSATLPPPSVLNSRWPVPAASTSTLGSFPVPSVIGAIGASVTFGSLRSPR